MTPSSTLRRFAALVSLLAAGPLTAADPPAATPIPFVEVSVKEPVVFDKHVFPILAEKCISCHDAEGGLAEGKLDLMTVAGALKGGKRGTAVVPGKGDESRLVRMSARLQKPVMPPKDEVPLTPAELSLVKAWVDQGAKPGENLRPGDALRQNEVELGSLPPGVQPVYALDLDPKTGLIAAGRANVVVVYDLFTGGLRAALPGHADIVQSVALSPDGRWLAAGGYKNVLLWEVPADRERGAVAGVAAPQRVAVASPKGDVVAVGGDDRLVRLVEAGSGKEVRQFAGLPGNVTAVAFSKDGARLAVVTADGKVSLFQTDGKALATFDVPGGSTFAAAFSPADGDAALLATAGQDGAVRLWNVSPAELGRLAAPDPKTKKAAVATPRLVKGHGGPVRLVAFNPAGTELVTASSDNSVRVWKVADGANLKTYPQNAPLTAFAAAPDASSVAVAATVNNESVVRLVKTADGAATTPVPAHAKPIPSLAFSADGKQLATGGDNVPRVWDVATGRLAHVFTGHAGPVAALAFADGGKTLVSASEDKSARRWDAAEPSWGKPAELGPFADRVIALAFSPDGKLLATGGGQPAASGELTLWDVAARKSVRTFKDAHSDTVFAVAFSPDGKRLASGAADKFLRVHDVADGKLVKTLEGHTHHVLALAWKPDGKQLVSGGADNLVKQWDVDAGEKIKDVAGHGKQVTATRYIGGSDKFVTASGDGQVRRVSAAGQVERAFPGGKDYLYTVAATPDGKLLVAGGQEGKIFVWNGESGQLVRTLEPKP